MRHEKWSRGGRSSGGPSLLDQWRPPKAGESGFLAWLRRLSLVLAIGGLVPLLGTLAFGSARPVVFRAIGAVVALGLVKVAARGARTGGVPGALFVVEGVALVVIILACGVPEAVIGLSVALVMGRSLFGSRSSTIGAAIVYSGAFLVGVAMTVVSGTTTDLGRTVAVPVLLFVLAPLLHLVAVSLRRYERSTQRDAILSRIGAQLAAASDIDAVQEALQDAVEAVGGTDKRVRIMVLLGTIADLEFVAVVGPTARDVLGTQVDARLLPQPLLDQLVAERSVKLDEEISCLVRTLYDGSDVGDAMLVAALRWGGDVRGAILVAGPTAVLTELRSLTESLGDVVSFALERIGRGEARFRALVQHSTDVFTVAGLDGKIKYVSPSVQRVTGFTEAEVMAAAMDTFVHPDDRDLVIRAAVSTLGSRGDTASFEARMRHKDGSYRHVQTFVTNLVDDPAIAGIMMTSRDITDRKALEEALNHRAFHDNLTGLANRTLFSDRVGQALARGARGGTKVAVLFCDLDDFKVVNDTFGHHAGDELLQEVARRLTASLRPGDTAARLGGDEFAVLLDDVAGAEDAMAVAERFSSSLLAPVTVRDRQVVVRASIGVALGVASETSGTDLVRDADLAMYRAKDRGKGGVAVFTASPREAASPREVHLASR